MLGDEALDLYDTFTFEAPAPPQEEEDEGEPDPEAHVTVAAILDKFREYCKPKIDSTYERYIFNQRQQAPGKPMNEYTSP